MIPIHNQVGANINGVSSDRIGADVEMPRAAMHCITAGKKDTWLIPRCREEPCLGHAWK